MTQPLTENSSIEIDQIKIEHDRRVWLNESKSVVYVEKIIKQKVLSEIKGYTSGSQSVVN